jgi:hypothetical protein
MPGALERDPEVRQGIHRFQSLLSRERRRCPRQPFPVVRHIAQAAGDDVPEGAAFFPVRCRDLSADGFSFLAKARPGFRSLVLALDAPPKTIYLAADVKHCTSVAIYPSGRVEVLHGRDPPADGEPCRANTAESWVLVGCQFTRRLAEPEDQEPSVD